jgi:hypothetical protein
MKFSADHHDWDMTLSSAKALLELGKNQDNHSFACFTGSMVLSVAALESFLNSLGYSEGIEANWPEFERAPIIDKMKNLGAKLGISVDAGLPPYQIIAEAIRWRNNLMHSKPVSVRNIEIENMEDVRKITNNEFKNKYEFQVSEENAIRFYSSICKVLIKFEEAGGDFPDTGNTYSNI